MTLRHEFAISAILGITLMSGVATAGGEDGKAESKRHFDVGTRLYEVEDYQGAVSEFETSVNLYPTKNAYFNLANCYKALHRYYEAQKTVEMLEVRFGDKLDKTMQNKLNDLKSLIESVTGTLTINVDPRGAKISLNGKPLTSDFVGRPLPLGPGDYRVEASLDGFQSQTKNVAIQSKKDRTLRLSLTPLKGSLKVETDLEGATVTVDGQIRAETPSAPIPLSPGEHRVEISVEGIVQEVRTVQIHDGSMTTLALESAKRKDDVSASKPPRKRHPVFFPLKIAGISATAATAVLTGVFYGLAAVNASNANDYSNLYTSAATPDDQAEVAKKKWLDAKNKTDRFAAVGLAMAVSTGVLALSTAAVFIVEKKSAKKSAAATLSVQDGLLTVSF